MQEAYYYGLANKTRYFFQQVIQSYPNVTWVVKADDDVYLMPYRLLQAARSWQAAGAGMALSPLLVEALLVEGAQVTQRAECYAIVKRRSSVPSAEPIARGRSAWAMRACIRQGLSSQ